MKIGLRSYLAVYAALREPQTAPEISFKLGHCGTSTEKLLSEFYSMGLVHIAAWHPGLVSGTPFRVWKAGPGTDAIYLRAGYQRSKHRCGPPRPIVGKTRPPRKVRPRPTVIAFKHLLDALVDPVTIKDLVQETGMAYLTCLYFCKEAKRLGLAGIVEWTHVGSTLTPMYQLGAVSKQRPRPDTRAISRRYRQNLKQRPANTILYQFAA